MRARSTKGRDARRPHLIICHRLLSRYFKILNTDDDVMAIIQAASPKFNVKVTSYLN